MTTYPTLYDFIRLDLKERFGIVRDKGQLLFMMQAKDEWLFLHNLNTFYVEVQYDKKLNQVKEVIPFRSMRRLDAYLERIDLEKLLYS